MQKTSQSKCGGCDRSPGYSGDCLINRKINLLSNGHLLIGIHIKLRLCTYTMYSFLMIMLLLHDTSATCSTVDWKKIAHCYLCYKWQFPLISKWLRGCQEWVMWSWGRGVGVITFLLSYHMIDSLVAYYYLSYYLCTMINYGKTQEFLPEIW